MLAAISIALLTALHPVPGSGAEMQGEQHRDRPFVVYDNMFYRGKPANDGLVASNILYENRIWPDKEKIGLLPRHDDFISLVRAHIANPGPLVIDIESLPLSGDRRTAHAHMEVLATLAVWAHEAAPSKIIGYYGTHTLTGINESYLGEARELAHHVDAFFPPMYTFDDDRSAWSTRAKKELEEARRLDAHKPVYFYLWPQYHDGTAKQFQFVSAEYWKFQLEQTYGLGDGAVLWSPSKFDWDDRSGWWSATVEFMREHQLRSRGAP